MKLRTLALSIALALSTSAEASAQVFSFPTIDPGLVVIQPTWKCRKWDLTACTSSELSNPAYRQILVMPTGYTDSERGAFWADFDALVTQMSNTGSVWSTTKRDRILYVGYFTGGGALNTSTASFAAAVLDSAINDQKLALNAAAVTAKINDIRASAIPTLTPMAVDVLYNDSSSGITPSATPPQLFTRGYGLLRMNRQHLKDPAVATRGLARAGLGFALETVMPGLEDLNIRSLDAASPLILFTRSWGGFVEAISDMFGVYDYNLSEILANNGNDNIALSAYPSTVSSPISARISYPYEGGFAFGRGTFHASGNNLMNGSFVMRGADDGFAFAHSSTQQNVINTAFGDRAYRANDRLRTAGPKDGWPSVFGSTTTVLLFDADKNHRFHPTQRYTVQVGWWERQWKTCWSSYVPTPCYDDVWRVAEKTVYPSKRTMDLKGSSLYGLSTLAQRVLCEAGVHDIAKPDGGTFALCEQPLSDVASAFLPTFSFATPYQETTVPATAWFTTYWWRFKSNNGTTDSGWTGWSSFYRSL